MVAHHKSGDLCFLWHHWKSSCKQETKSKRANTSWSWWIQGFVSLRFSIYDCMKPVYYRVLSHFRSFRTWFITRGEFQFVFVFNSFVQFSSRVPWDKSLTKTWTQKKVLPVTALGTTNSQENSGDTCTFWDFLPLPPLSSPAAICSPFQSHHPGASYLPLPESISPLCDINHLTASTIIVSRKKIKPPGSANQ